MNQLDNNVEGNVGAGPEAHPAPTPPAEAWRAPAPRTGL